MVGIIDYGVGNLLSVCNALEFLGIPHKITADPDELGTFDRLILPGVGAFPYAMNELDRRGLTPAIKDAAPKVPFLGICLGMQLLFEVGYEFEMREGLGLIPGKIDRIPDSGLRIPHIGWNGLDFKADSPLLDGLTDGDYCYFVHSYMAFADSKYVSASVDYGVAVPALVQNGNIFGTQFHPEKSSRVGLKMLGNFGGL